MSRKSRFQYKSRRERLKRDLGNIRLILIFFGIALVVWMIMRRQEIFWWLESLYYRIF
jgi:hypothetical protein